MVSRSLNEVSWIIITVGFILKTLESPKRKKEMKQEVVASLTNAKDKLK